MLVFEGAGMVEIVDAEDRTIWIFEKEVYYGRTIYYNKKTEIHYLSAFGEYWDDTFLWETEISEFTLREVLAKPDLFQVLLDSDREWIVKKPWAETAYLKTGRLGPADGYLNSGYGRPSW